MNANEFVACWKNEKNHLVELMLGKGGDTHISKLITSMDLTTEQAASMPKLVDAILTDAFYALLLGLDGSASIGGVQQTYRLLHGDGSPISEPGALEAEAWEQFFGDA